MLSIGTVSTLSIADSTDAVPWQKKDALRFLGDLCYRTVVVFGCTWYGGRPRSRPHCVFLRWKPSSPQKGVQKPLLHFSAHVYCCQTVTHLSYYWALVSLVLRTAKSPRADARSAGSYFCDRCQVCDVFRRLTNRHFVSHSKQFIISALTTRTTAAANAKDDILFIVEQWFFFGITR